MRRGAGARLAILHRVRDGSAVLRRSSRSRPAWRWGCALALVTTIAGCGREEPDPALIPDELLQTELGLTPEDRVHRVRVGGGRAEHVEPAETVVAPGAYVQFATTDWLVHEVVFEADSLGPDALRFMEELDQLASPPMVARDSRFVVSFVDAPPARYPYRVEGNGAPARGVVIVRAPTEG